MSFFLKLRFVIQGLMDEEGQDLVEYALIVAMLALVLVSTMNFLATAISNVFSTALTAA